MQGSESMTLVSEGHGPSLSLELRVSESGKSVTPESDCRGLSRARGPLLLPLPRPRPRLPAAGGRLLGIVTGPRPPGPGPAVLPPGPRPGVTRRRHSHRHAASDGHGPSHGHGGCDRGSGYGSPS
jgi:hypothetical protein